MFSSFSPYVSQGLMPQSFVGLPLGAGPQSAYGIGAPFGHEHQAQSPYAFGVATNPNQQNPFMPNQNPQLWQNPLLQGASAHNPFSSGAYIPAQQLVPVLVQLAQQISIQSGLIQQLGIALQQLVQQLTAQSLQAHQGAGLGAGLGAGGSPFGGIGQAAGAGGPFSAHYPFAAATQGYGGFNPQAQPWWNGNRAQTIQ